MIEEQEENRRNLQYASLINDFRNRYFKTIYNDYLTWYGI